MAADTMTLPKGFVLEEPNLPKDFILEQPQEQSVEPTANDLAIYQKMGVKQYRSPTGKLYDLGVQKDLPQQFSEPAISDPSSPPEGFIPEVESRTSFLRRMMSLGGKGLWSGLGIVSWPLERIEYAIATPATALTETIAPLVREPFKDVVKEELIESPVAIRKLKEEVRAGLTPYAKEVLGEQLEPLLEKSMTRMLSVPPEQRAAELDKVLKTEVLPALKKTPSALATGGKALVPYPLEKMGVEPEDLKTFDDMWGAYYKGMLGEEAPVLYKRLAGIGTSFLVTPVVFGKLLKGIGATAKLTGIPQKIQKARLPLWQRAKMRARMKMGARVERATELGKSVARKDLKQLARELSKETSRPVSTRAVQQRLGQIIKGSITTQPKLAAKANPIIEEFEKTSKTLRQLGILGEETYLTKLPKGRVADLIKQKTQLQSRMAKLQKVPYKKSLTKAISGLKIEGKEKLTADLWNLANTVSANEAQYIDRLGQILGVKTTQPARLMHMVERFGKASAKERTKIIDTLWDLGEKNLGRGIVGIKPLMKKIASMKRRFPGQAAKTAELQKKIDKINDTLWKSTHVGGEQYMPRMYRSKEEERLARKFLGWSKHRIRAHYAKQRKPIPPEVRRLMGEIKEPAYPVMKRLIQEGSDIETAKLFEFAARHPDWVSNEWLPGLAKKALPDTKAFGVLKGKFVAQRIYDDVMELNRTRGNFEQLYDTLIGSWKLGKVVLNPATHMRNKISNKILLDLSGMGFGEQGKYALKALKHYRGNTKEYQIAKRYFARTTQVKGELLDDMLRTTGTAKGQSLLQKGVNATRRGVKWITKKPSDIYQHEEFVNKFMKYLQQRDQGKSILQSVEEANKWLFDYSDLAVWESKITRRVMPFYTFPRKALPRVLETAIERPLTLAKYPLLAKMTTQYSLAKLKMTERDYEDLKEVLPDYMQKGSYILMPYRDNNGDLRFFDWTYIVPWGELYDAHERGLLKTGITNPIFQILADFSRNKSGWTDKEIWKETDTTQEKTFKQMKYLWGSLVPSLAPEGLYWDKLEEVATGKPSKYGKERLPVETLAHILLGLRTQPIDIQQQKKWRLFEKQGQIKEMRSKMADVIMRRNSGNITTKEFEKKKEQYLKQVKEILTGKKEKPQKTEEIPEGFILE